MKTKLAILTVLCSASLWAWSQTSGGSSSAGNAPAGAAGNPPVSAPARPPTGAPGHPPNNGFTDPGMIPPGNGINGTGDGGSQPPGFLPSNIITNHSGTVRPNTRFYNGGMTNQ